MSNLRSDKGTVENPFHVELVKEFNVIQKREYISGEKGVQHMVIDSQGVAIGESRFFKIKKVDDEQFAKIFTNKMAHMWDMIPAATRVYTYILSHLPISKSEMYFHIEGIQKYCRYKSQGSVWKGVKWLVENNFIAKSYKPNHYWLNPTMFFNGDRVAFVDMIVKKGSQDDVLLDKNKSKRVIKQHNLFGGIDEMPDGV